LLNLLDREKPRADLFDVFSLQGVSARPRFSVLVEVRAGFARRRNVFRAAALENLFRAGGPF
jgi:hypothetical protein